MSTCFTEERKDSKDLKYHFKNFVMEMTNNEFKVFFKNILVHDISLMLEFIQYFDMLDLSETFFENEKSLKLIQNEDHCDELLLKFDKQQFIDMSFILNKFETYFNISHLNIIENKIFNEKFSKYLEYQKYIEYYSKKNTHMPYLQEGMKCFVYSNDFKENGVETYITSICHKYFKSGMMCQEQLKFECYDEDMIFFNSRNKRFRCFLTGSQYNELSDKKIVISLSKIDERQFNEFPLTHILFDYYEIIHKETFEVLKELFKNVDENLLKYIVYTFI